MYSKWLKVSSHYKLSNFCEVRGNDGQGQVKDDQVKDDDRC